MLKEMLEKARAGLPLWLPDVRDLFLRAADGVPVVLRLSLCDGRARDYAHRLPRWNNAEERRLVFDYLRASVFNVLSVCGGRELRFYFDLRETDVAALVGELEQAFQTDAGLNKVLRIAERMGRAFGGTFSFAVSDVADDAPLPAEPERTPPALGGTLRRLCAEAESLNCVGIDVGGTDIKLAASAGGRLVAVKEYDWNPAASPTVEGILDPILLLLRLLRACIAAEGTPFRARLDAALRKNASGAEMAGAVAEAEAALDTNVLDAVGVSFPDVVLRDRVVGGETPKTDGMRRNPDRDYEAEFARLGALKDAVLALCRPGGRCHITNDGNIAAFTAAMELACGGADADIRGGVIAHTLGTDLGTGWLDADGSIPQLPLELYDLLIDLGSRPSAALPPGDLRSTRNENSGLPGARRYLGQAAAWRLGYALDPEMVKDYIVFQDGAPIIAMQPKDLRKECLAHLMALADAGVKPEAEEVFRQIGRHLATVTREFDDLLGPETDTRFLFGRFVKSRRCFALLCEGFGETAAHIRLERADEELANTPLMRRLAGTPGVTVAQFGQAVGAIYFALT